MPRLTIVIPTHHRPHLLETAVRSILADSPPPEVEILVSDNSQNRSAASVVERLAHPQLRYVATDTDLDIYQSWNFAIDRVQGNYSLLLGDDNAVMKGGLRRILTALDTYNSPDYLGLAIGWYSRPGFARGPSNATWFDESYTREGTFDPEELLKEYFAFGRPSFSATYLLVSSYVRETLRARRVPIYLPLFPDYALQGSALAVARSAAVMCDPTVLHGYAKESLGEAYCYPREKIEWPPPEGETQCFRYSPVNGYTFQNGRLETMLRVQHALFSVDTYDIDLLAFLTQYGKELIREGIWRDVSRNGAEYLRLIDGLEEPGRGATLEKLGALILQLMAIMRVRPWEHMTYQNDKFFRGEEYDFSDIVECAAKAEKLFQIRRERAEVLNKIQEESQPIPPEDSATIAAAGPR